jgi:hypothetical protein
MEQLEHFEKSIKQAISAAHTGILSTEHAVMLLADAGGVGVGTVHFVRVGSRDSNVIEFLYSFDTGSRTVGNFFAQNDSYLVITADRKYIVSKQHRLGDPLGIADTRLTTPTQDCPLMVYTANGNYRIMNAGTFQCTTYGGSQHSISTWGKGQYVHLGHMDSCQSSCMTVGPLHYRMEHRELGSIPSVHSNALRHHIVATDHTVQSIDTTRTNADKMQREMQALIEETRTQIDMINIEQSTEKEVIGAHWGWISIGVILLLVGGMIVVGIIGIKHWRKRANRREPVTNNHQLPVMEMRLLAPEGPVRTISRTTSRQGMIYTYSIFPLYGINNIGVLSCSWYSVQM